MNWRNTTDRYGAVAIGLHWVVAILVIVLLVVGLVMTGMKPGPDMLRIYATHKSIGITVLALAVLRLTWKLANPHPAALPTHRQWEKLLAKAVHIFLYFAIVAMPLSGWIMSSAKGFPVSVFGWFTLPDLVPPDKDLTKAASQFHEMLAYSLIVAIVLHFSGALKHHLIDKDGTLRRMLPCPCRARGDCE